MTRKNTSIFNVAVDMSMVVEGVRGAPDMSVQEAWELICAKYADADGEPTMTDGETVGRAIVYAARRLTALKTDNTNRAEHRPPSRVYMSQAAKRVDPEAAAAAAPAAKAVEALREKIANAFGIEAPEKPAAEKPAPRVKAAKVPATRKAADKAAAQVAANEARIAELEAAIAARKAPKAAAVKAAAPVVRKAAAPQPTREIVF